VTPRFFASALSLVFTCLLSGFGHAQILLDTGTPNGNSIYVISTASSIEAEFAGTKGQTITQLSAYLTNPPGDNYSGDFFTFNLYSSLRTTGNRTNPIFSTTATFTGNGWNTASNLSFVLPSTGDFWLAVQGSSPGITYDAPSSANTGGAPALAFAFSSTASNYYTISSPGIGLAVTAAPEPTSWALLLGGLASLLLWLRRPSRLQV
jgi:hypothetical protein